MQQWGVAFGRPCSAWRVLLWLLLLAPLSAGAAQQELKNIRLIATGEGARVVFDLSGKTDYSLFTLENPARIVVDLEQTRGAAAEYLRGPLPGGVTGIRSAARNSEDLRVVLDLKAPLKPRSFLLEPSPRRGHRLVVELLREQNEAQRSVAPGPLKTNAGQAKQTLSVREHGQAAVVRTDTAMPRQVRPAVVALRSKPVRTRQRESEKTRLQSAKAKVTSKARPTFPLPRNLIIAIDAGHGGKDPGASGRRGTREKAITLSIARKLAELVEAEYGMDAVLVRDGDYYITLRGRIRKARRVKADLFVSIHADAFHRLGARGASVYVLSDRGATSEAARWLAARENAVELLGGVKLEGRDRQLARVLLDLSQNATLESSHDLASEVLASLGKVARLHDSSVERAGFLVLKSPDIPSILVETGFLSNPDEELLLRDPDHQHHLAEAVLRGVRSYVRHHPVAGTLLALRRHKIEAGDTLSQLAKHYAVSLEELRQVNQLKSDLIRVGQVLRIPAGRADG